MGNFNIEKEFGKNVFNDKNMQRYLSKSDYEKLKKIIEGRLELDSKVAKDVAKAMMSWAVENGATHYTHWFQPLNGMVAEKQNAFINIEENKKPILSFSEKELIKGETDASSFPSGNIRATFEARGYTIWDCTSPAFLRKVGESIVLYIPTAFISYGGEALDNKTPLLKSMQAIDIESKKLLKLFGMNVKKVESMLGAEQEYFLIERNKYLKRRDLIYSGRTLFGAKTPKGQELYDHYYGAIRTNVLDYMKEVNEELWKLGVPAQTQHNEVAPCQHELASIYEESNIACDHNQLIMETLKRVATKHNMVCLLHEKPFKWVNGSGKHNNWSIVADGKFNLLNPGKAPNDNLLFLLVLSCVISAVDKHAKLLRASCATPGKEQRLGATEAPPAIISCYLGDQLLDVVNNFITNGFAENSKEGKKLDRSINTMPDITMDATDRNRTSPFAFTGNKFEFRMVGSNDSCEMPITVLNTIVANEFSIATEILSKSNDFEKDLRNYIKNNFADHKRILFDGDGYSEEWMNEAKQRGLCDAKSIVDIIPSFNDKETIDLFGKFNVLSENELRCRYNVAIENYNNISHIEATTMIDIAKKYILPACIHYTTRLSNSINAIRNVDGDEDTSVQKELLDETIKNIREMKNEIDNLEKYVIDNDNILDDYSKAQHFRDVVVPCMNRLRMNADTLEMIVDKNMWPLPSYGDMLFEV